MAAREKRGLSERLIIAAMQPFASLFAKCAVDLIGQRLHQVRHHCAVARFYERLDRHSGHKLDLTEPCHLLRQQSEPDCIIALARALIGRDAG